MKMRADVWGAAFVFAIVIHIAGLALAGQGLLGEIDLKPKTEYMEIELAPAAPAQEIMQYQAVTPAATGRQNNSTVNNSAGTASVSAVNPAVPASEGRNLAAPAATVASASGIGPVVAISGDSGAATGTGGAGNAEAGPGGTGSVAAPAPPSEEQEVDRRPYVVYSPLPEYPSEARLNRWQGTVVVRALVEASGSVAEVRIAKSSGFDELDQAAEAVLYQWRFNPAYRDGQPVTIWVKVPVAFKLTK